MASVGLYRDETGWVQVRYDGGHEVPIPRDRYEENGYMPPFDKLPTRAEYEAQQNADRT